MTQPRMRIARTGTARLRSRPQYQVALLAIFALIISACSTPNPTSARIPTRMQAIEAEDAVLDGSVLTIRDEPGTSGGKVVVAPASIAPASEGAEEAAVPFEVTAEGDYVLWARVKGASNEESAMYLGFDGELERVELFRFGEYIWVAVTFDDLLAGEHFVSIGHAEPETSLDALVVSSRRDLSQEDLEGFLMSGEMPAPAPEEAPATDAPAEIPGGDAPGDEPEEPIATPAPAEPGTGAKAGFEMRGDPNFDPSTLSADAQVWHRRLWRSIDETRSDIYSDARSDDLYKYAREVHSYVQTLLHAFRVTGDLKILDEVDTIVELMRDQLHDSWRDVLDGSTSPGKDGYLNWVWRYSSGDKYVGKDLNKLDEIRTHSLIATVAHALDLNRDLDSPSGADYGKHADFWVDYLVNDFEAKWRDRENEPKDFPIMIRPIAHSYYSWMKWHYYMGLLTGDSAYTNEAERMADRLEGEVSWVDTSDGPAMLWAHSVMSEGGSEDYLEPTTYARYVFHDAVELHLEGFAWWSKSVLEGMARTVAEWVIDPENAEGSKDWFASDIGGGRDRGGIDSDSSWSRMSYHKYEISAYAEVAAWDSTGVIDEMTDDVLDKIGDPDEPGYPILPVSKLLTAMVAN